MKTNTITRAASDDVTPEGILQIDIVFGNRAPVTFFREIQRIMDESKAYVLRSVYDNAFTVDPLYSFKIGTGGTYTVGGTDVKPVTGDRTDLYTPITPSGNYPNILAAPTVSTDGKSVTYVFSISDTDLNGQVLNEVAMFRASANMFNMKTFPSITKTSGFSLNFTWTIRYK